MNNELMINIRLRKRLESMRKSHRRTTKTLIDTKINLETRIKTLESAMQEYIDCTGGRLWDAEVKRYIEKFKQLLEENENQIN